MVGNIEPQFRQQNTDFSTPADTSETVTTYKQEMDLK